MNKEICEECGKLIDISKIRISEIDFRNLCPYCFKSEKKSNFNRHELPKIQPMSKSMKNSKCLIKTTNSYNTTYLKKDELSFMNYKYGRHATDRINELKSGIKESKKRNKLNSIHKTTHDLNKKLWDGLK